MMSDMCYEVVSFRKKFNCLKGFKRNTVMYYLLCFCVEEINKQNEIFFQKDEICTKSGLQPVSELNQVWCLQNLNNLKLWKKN